MAQTPTIPTPLRPGPLPRSWFVWTNDAFGGEVGVNLDDFRTNAFSFGHQQEGWLFAVDHSTLTNRGDFGPPGRIDELTVSGGYRAYEERNDDQVLTLDLGLGVRLSGDLHGQDLQNAWHDTISFPEIDLPYEEEHVAGLAWFDLEWMVFDTEGLRDNPLFMSGGWFAITLDYDGLITTDGEFQGSIGTRNLWLGQDAALWAGFRYDFRGNARTQTNEIVADNEDGPWVTAGAAFGPLAFEAALNVETQISTGRIAYTRERSPYHADASDHVVTAELGGTTNSYGLSAQLRWRPHWLDSLGGFGERSSLLLGYRFGRVPDVEFEDASLRYQQGTLGWDVSWAVPRSGWQFNPFAQATFGWRLEDFVIEGPNANFGDRIEMGGMAGLAIGSRLSWGERPQPGGSGTSYGVSASIAYEYADRRATKRSGGEELVWLEDHFVGMLHFSVVTAW